MSGRPGGRDPSASLDAVRIREFLARAEAAGIVDEATVQRLTWALDHPGTLRPTPSRPDRDVASPAQMPQRETTVPRPPVPTTKAPTGRRLVPEVAPPVIAATPARERGRLRELVVSDLALHGLAYLGVLLMFVGTFGFVVFAFGEVDPALRPVAEAAIPVVCFLGAWFLNRRRAPHVAVALEALGGLTLPVVAFASFVDEAGIPPDPSGDALAFALAATAATIGVGYAWWARRHPESPLRYLVAPMVWLVAWAAGLALGPGEVDGSQIRRPSPEQMAWVTVAVTATVAAARIRSDRWLARETLAVAPVGLALGVGLGFATAPDAGWPAAPILVTGAAALVGLDLVAIGMRGSSRNLVRLVEAILLSGTAMMLVEPLGEAWAAAVAAVGAVALAERWRIDGIDELSALLLGVVAATGLAMSSIEAWPAVTAFGVVSVWVHLRRPEAAAALGPLAGVTATLLPVGVMWGLTEVLDDDLALVVSAGIVLAAAGLFHLRRDRFDGAWTAGAAIVVSAAAGASAVSEGTTGSLVAAAGIATIAAIVRPGSVASRLWTAFPVLLLTGVLGLDFAEVPADTIVMVAAGAGLVLVLASWLVPAEAGVPLEALGHLTTASALAVAVASTGGPRVACLGIWTAGWLWTAISTETRHDPLVAKLAALAEERGDPPWPRWVPAWVLAASVPALLVEAGSSAGWWTTQASQGVAVACLAALEAGATWLVRERPVPSRVAADASILTILAAWAMVADAGWPVVTVGTATVAAVVATAPRVRRPQTWWLAWAATAPIALRLAELWGGVAEDDLYAPLFLWGAVLSVGALALDEVRAGRREPGTLARSSILEPAAVLGMVGALGALAWVMTTQPADVWARWSLAGAVVALVLALQTRVGSVSAIAWALAIVAASELARDELLEEPWVAVAVAVVPAAIGVAGRTLRDRPLWLRWDVPALVTAHAMVLWALVQAFPADRVAPTWLGAAALSFALAIGLRAPVWAVAGGLLAIVGADALGPWWLALALALEATATWLVAARSERRVRITLQAAGAVLSAGSWAATLAATGWSDPTALRATAIVAGVVALIAGGLARARVLSPDWLVPAGALALVGWSRAGTVFHLQGMTSEDHLVLAASAAAIAVGAGVAAAPAKVAVLRDAAAVITLGAAAEAVLSRDPTPATGAALLVGASVVSLLVALALWRAARLTWVRPLIVVGAVAGVAALPVAAMAWPTRAPLVAALTALGAETAAAGMLLRRPVVLAASPLLLCAAWLVFATATFTGEPMWFTVPVGIAVLIVLETIRWDHRLRHEAVRTPELVAAELLAIAIVVGAAPIQIFTGHLWAGLSGAALGVGIATWGVETHVRRRVWAGVIATAGCLLLLALLPVVKELPNVEQTTLWALLVGLGVLVVVIATTIERSRPRLRAAMHHIHELMEGWE